jgi:ElaB/YqjD/DUF883 family membrane-anchored ribosome-binding protein
MANRLAEYQQSQSSSGWSMPQVSTDDVQRRMQSLLAQGQKWVVENPEAALAAAAVTGVVLGWLIKRR